MKETVPLFAFAIHVLEKQAARGRQKFLKDMWCSPEKEKLSPTAVFPGQESVLPKPIPEEA